MFLKEVFVTLLLGTLAAVWQCGSPTMSVVNHAVKPVETEMKSLKLVSEYKRNKLQEISSDGNLLLFYETSKPVRTYTLADGKGVANQPDTNSDVLRVVERASGRELGRIRVGFFPEDVQFIPGTQRVFYKEPKQTGAKLEWRIKIWDPASGEARECSGANAASQSFSLIDAQHALNIIRQPGKDHLAILALPDCSKTEAGFIENSAPIAGRVSFSPSRKEMAYVMGQQVVVRNTATLNAVKEIGLANGMMRLGENAIYTPDGKFLVVLATNTIFDKPETKRFWYFYDTTNYQLARQLEVTSWSPPVVNDEVSIQSNMLGNAIAVAPDGRTMAIAYTKDESGKQQAQVVLYDLETGKEIGRASHPATKENREDPFAAKIGKLAFTPDGKYLFSSTHDTLVWEVPS